jgi:ACR3 family arsenite transporter
VSATETHTPPAPVEPKGPKRMCLFERHLALRVGLCMAAGVFVGRTCLGLTI